MERGMLNYKLWIRILNMKVKNFGAGSRSLPEPMMMKNAKLVMLSLRYKWVNNLKFIDFFNYCVGDYESSLTV